MLIIPCLLFSQNTVDFDKYFIDKTLRIDFFHTGNDTSEVITIDKIYKYSTWAGNPEHCLDTFNNGKYYIKIYDRVSNTLIYSKGFNTIFGEYQTTNPALKGLKRTFHETALIPCPQKSFFFVIESRNKNNFMHGIFIREINPHGIGIINEAAESDIKVYKVLDNGNPHKKVDLAWIAEGYTADEYEKFKNDVDIILETFLSIEPYKNFINKFNIYGVFKPSYESGTDQPEENIFKNTALNSSFNALNLSRYLLTEDNRSLRNIASVVPYDAIIIMVNHNRYGGGGIYNSYAISTVHNKLSKNVFLHEFGHSFAGLADEYYASSVAYNDFYPKGIEPVEPNITALLNPAKLKWKNLVSQDISIPTEWGKEEIEFLQNKSIKIRKMIFSSLDSLRKNKADANEIKVMKATLEKKLNETKNKLKEIKEKFSFLKYKVGAFEGAGYSAKGLYRPELNCLMFSNQEIRFCKVCQDAIKKMILFYTD